MEGGSPRKNGMTLFSLTKNRAHTVKRPYDVAPSTHSNKSKAAHDPPTYTLTSFVMLIPYLSLSSTAVSSFYQMTLSYQLFVFWKIMVHAPCHG